MRDPNSFPEKDLVGKERFSAHSARASEAGGRILEYEDGSTKILIPGKRAGVKFIETTLYGPGKNNEVLSPTEEHFKHMGVYGGLIREMEATKE